MGATQLTETPAKSGVVTGLNRWADSTRWWEHVCDRTDTPVRDLIDGFDEIAHQAIPFGWLPGRARTFYGADYTIWSDLADETIYTLTDRPKGGISTVRAIVIAARKAAAAARSTATGEAADADVAIARLFDPLDDYDYGLLAARVWALDPLTIPVTAARLGAAQVNVQRTTPRAYRRLLDLVADPAHAAVNEYAAQLRQRLGSLTREPTAADALRDVGLELTGDAGQLLLHLAGPYIRRGTWLERAGSDSVRAAAENLDATIARFGAPTTTALTDELATLDIRADTAADFMADQAAVRRFDDRWVHWSDTIADKIEAALHLSGLPLSAATIATTIECHEKSVRVALWDDPRFMRASKQTWALRRWNIAEYHGLYTEIATRIDAAGGAINTQAVVDDIMSKFPDVAEKSVHLYMSAPGFVTDNGMVRHRTKADEWPASLPPTVARGVFHNGRNELRVALPITVDTLRGSGQHVHPAVATAFGIRPGTQRTFTGKPVDIAIFWRLSATSGPSIGSLRALATRLRAELGDTLVLAFNSRDTTVTAKRIRGDERPRQRLRSLLGKTVHNPKTDLARSLRCRTEELAALLRRRGDDHIVDLIDEVRL